jgi:hypothetical protein
MKARLRREQRERTKTSVSNIQNSSSDNKSQENNNNQAMDKKKKGRNKSVEISPELLAEIKANKINSTNLINKKPSEQKNVQKLSKEESKEIELSKIATMFNFEIDKKREIIKIQDNDEYYDMREQINKLEKEYDKSRNQYENLIKYNKENNESQKQQIAELEKELKKNVDNDIEKIKKDNIILIKDINFLDKKLESLEMSFKKEKYDMNMTINDLDNTIRKLKGELYFVDDLKIRLKNLTTKDIPQELVESINYILKEDIAAQYRITPTHSNIGSVRSRTGIIPISDFLDVSLDSQKSVKRLEI